MENQYITIRVVYISKKFRGGIMKSIIRNIMIAFVSLSLVFYGVGKVANNLSNKDNFKKVSAIKNMEPIDSLIETIKLSVTNSEIKDIKVMENENGEKPSLFVTLSSKGKEDAEKDMLRIIYKLKISKSLNDIKYVYTDFNIIELNEKNQKVELGKVGEFNITSKEIKELSFDKKNPSEIWSIKEGKKYWDNSFK